MNQLNVSSDKCFVQFVQGPILVFAMDPHLIAYSKSKTVIIVIWNFDSNGGMCCTNVDNLHVMVSGLASTASHKMPLLRTPIDDQISVYPQKKCHHL